MQGLIHVARRNKADALHSKPLDRPLTWFIGSMGFAFDGEQIYVRLMLGKDRDETLRPTLSWDQFCAKKAKRERDIAALKRPSPEVSRRRRSDAAKRTHAARRATEMAGA